MRYKFTGEGIIEIRSTEASTDDGRWELLSPYQMRQRFNYAKWGWFNEILSRKDEITSLALGNDKFIERPIIAKTINYRLHDLESEDGIYKRRSSLIEQVRILNDLRCPLLPEVFDWFTVYNHYDPIIFDACRESEPVLIQDYIPGISLDSCIKNKFRRNKKEQEDGEENSTDSILDLEYEKIGSVIDVQKIARFGLKIFYFIKYLENKGYTNVALLPEHIISLNNDTPRFVGIGRICKTTDEGKVDFTHINSSRTAYGFSAPELNDWGSVRRENSEGKKVSLFTLGVLIHQMIIGENKIRPEMIKGSSFVYPNGLSENFINSKGYSGNLFHKLIVGLCNHNEEKRLSDFDDVENILSELAQINMGKNKEPIREEKKPISGVVINYESENIRGFVETDTGEIYRINRSSIKNISEINRSKLKSGAKVEFYGNIRYEKNGNKKCYVDNILTVKKEVEKNSILDELFRDNTNGIYMGIDSRNNKKDFDSRNSSSSNKYTSNIDNGTSNTRINTESDNRSNGYVNNRSSRVVGTSSDYSSSRNSRNVGNSRISNDSTSIKKKSLIDKIADLFKN